MRIAIVEDELKDANLLTNYVKKYNQENELNIEATVFRNPVDFLSDYTGEFDAVFLDIEMPMMDGMETARRLRRMDSDVSIIFVTNLAQYAIGGYEVGALDYILKPVDYFSFIFRLEKVMTAHMGKEDSVITIKTKDSIQCIKTSEIYYIESDKHYVHYHTAKGTFTTRKTLTAVMEELKNTPFERCSKSYFVNVKHVTEVQKDTVIVGKASVPLSRSMREQFLNVLFVFFRRRR